MMNENISGQNTTEKFQDIQNLSSLKLGWFKITPIGEPKMYANGNQQCKVEIQIEKLIFDEKNSIWLKQSLTSAEISSIKIAEFSSNVLASLPNGWYKDDTKNKFDIGFISGTFSEMDEFGFDVNNDENFAQNSIEDGSLNVTERASYQVFTRFLRCASSVPIQPQKLMATIRLDNGETYSTHSVSDESYVTITPIAPYRINVGNLLNHRRDDAYTANGYDVDIYYWQLPYSLRILEEVYSGQGHTSSKLLYFTDKKPKSKRFICATIKSNVSYLTIKDIVDYVNDTSSVNLKENNQFIRALRFAFNSHVSTNYDNRLSYNITDNFGCVHKYIFNSIENFNMLTISNG
ncbi:hypothetical protein [Fluviispira sanaruensis]|uniref:Uncharacterized protein n=1 Tax=Fluviispira sanaruensis TaxID=2493639 RepID=A0A4P2VNM1_FLUSA|nr:hypothetical protein [Fluviispira sanaruensis]BBH53754.1 hypothetical protein JCM31447_22020 [Fluviispira sanaruensis]